MANAAESTGTDNSFLNAALAAGIETLSYVQEVDFTLYKRVVLPLDGFVFWVKADQLSPSALFNTSPFDTAQLDQLASVDTPAQFIRVKGSLHYISDLSQDQSETFVSNRVIFTSENEVKDLNEVNPSLMYVGTFDGIKFAFGSRGSFYRQADIYHYVGRAIYSIMASQLIDDPEQLRNRLIVSNSLPIWLSMNNYKAQPWEVFSNDTFPLFPSFLSPQNEVPPFATIHIEPTGTVAIGSAPRLDRTYGHTQLCKDLVRVVMYGIDNDAALTFMDFVNQFSVNYDSIGLLNMPVIRDDKRPQVEFGILAQRKSVDFEVSYYQSVARDIARQLIKTVIINYAVPDP